MLADPSSPVSTSVDCSTEGFRDIFFWTLQGFFGLRFDFSDILVLQVLQRAVSANFSVKGAEKRMIDRTNKRRELMPVAVEILVWISTK